MANPGSDKAIKDGCLCPVLDNHHGRGYMGQAGVFVYSELCPIQGYKVAMAEVEARRLETDAAAAETKGDG